MSFDQRGASPVRRFWRIIQSMTLSVRYLSSDQQDLLSTSSPVICDEAFEMLAAEFRAIKSLPQIIVKVDSGGLAKLSECVKNKIRSIGWPIKVIPPHGRLGLGKGR